MTLLLLSELGTIVIFARVQIEQLVFMQGEVITINREDFFRRQVLGIIEHPFNSMKQNIMRNSRMSEMTTEILEQNLGKIVLVRLKGGKSLRGRLKGFDQHLNLVLEETDDTTNIENTKKLGLIIVRGDNVVLISPPPRWYLPWVKVHRQWANDKAKSSTYAADVAEDILIMSVKNVAPHVVMEKLKSLGNIDGKPRQFRVREWLNSILNGTKGLDWFSQRFTEP
jgi:small nuclear ribonucleoprotein